MPLLLTSITRASEATRLPMQTGWKHGTGIAWARPSEGGEKETGGIREIGPWSESVYERFQNTLGDVSNELAASAGGTILPFTN